jgi:hypothetical protein
MMQLQSTHFILSIQYGNKMVMQYNVYDKPGIWSHDVPIGIMSVTPILTYVCLLLSMAQT